MSDQGKWFKLWCSSLRDDDLENLSIHEWFAWARFGAHMKENGKDGKIRLREPATAILNLLRVPSFKDAVDMLKRFPNYVVEETQSVTVDKQITIAVKCKNWNKYQGDWSRDRVRKHRKAVTANVTAQEEKRREEKRKEETLTSSAPDGRVQHLIDRFYQKAGKPMSFPGGAAGSFFKSLLKKMSLELIEAYMDSWFNSTDPFIVKEAFRFGLFVTKFDALKGGPIHAQNSTANRRPANAFVASPGEASKYD